MSEKIENAALPVIAISDLHKSYGAVSVFSGISLNVMRGEVVVLIGPSGCGKSTLLRCINLLEEPEQGSIRVGSKSVTYGRRGERKPDSTALARFRSDIGMVFQNFNLFPHKTVLENVAIGPIVVKKMHADQAKQLGLKLLDRVGLKDKASSYPTEISGGQAQRVAIARALSMEPKVILFDEVTSALDPELVGEVLSVMKELAREDVTMIVVTHEIAFANDVADRVIFMDKGQLVEDGPPSQVLNTPSNPRLQAFLSRVHAV